MAGDITDVETKTFEGSPFAGESTVSRHAKRDHRPDHTTTDDKKTTTKHHARDTASLAGKPGVTKVQKVSTPKASNSAKKAKSTASKQTTKSDDGNNADDGDNSDDNDSSDDNDNSDNDDNSDDNDESDDNDKSVQHPSKANKHPGKAKSKTKSKSNASSTEDDEVDTVTIVDQRPGHRTLNMYEATQKAHPTTEVTVIENQGTVHTLVPTTNSKGHTVLVTNSADDSPEATCPVSVFIDGNGVASRHHRCGREGKHTATKTVSFVGKSHPLTSTTDNEGTVIFSTAAESDVSTSTTDDEGTVIFNTAAESDASTAETKTIEDPETTTSIDTIEDFHTITSTKTIEDHDTTTSTKTIQDHDTTTWTKAMQDHNTTTWTKTIQDHDTSTQTRTIQDHDTTTWTKTIQDHDTTTWTKTIQDHDMSTRTKTIEDHDTTTTTRMIQKHDTTTRTRTVESVTTLHPKIGVPTTQTTTVTKVITQTVASFARFATQPLDEPSDSSSNALSNGPSNGPFDVLSTQKSHQTCCYTRKTWDHNHGWMEATDARTYEHPAPSLMPLTWDPNYLSGWEHIMDMDLSSIRAMHPDAPWAQIPRIAYQIRQHQVEIDPERGLKYAFVMLMRAATNQYENEDRGYPTFSQNYPTLSHDGFNATKTWASLSNGHLAAVTAPTMTIDGHTYVVDPLLKYRMYDPRHHAVAPTGSCRGDNESHHDNTNCKIDHCMWQYMKPINITTIQPMVMYDYRGRMVYDYFTHTTELREPHWGTKDSRGIYYPATMAWRPDGNHTMTRHMARQTPTDLVRKKKDRVQPDPACWDPETCYDVCYQKPADWDPKILAYIGAPILIVFLAALFCCCCLALRRRRRRDPNRRKSSNISEKLGRKNSHPDTVVVNQASGSVTDNSGHPVESSTAATTAVVAGTAAGAGAAGEKREGDGQADGRGTTGRRAEEGRGRVNFEDGGNPGSEPGAHASEHAEVAPGESTAPQPVADKDGATGTGRQAADMGSVRGRKRSRPEGAAGALGLGF